MECYFDDNNEGRGAHSIRIRYVDACHLLGECEARRNWRPPASNLTAAQISSEVYNGSKLKLVSASTYVFRVDNLYNVYGIGDGERITATTSYTSDESLELQRIFLPSPTRVFLLLASDSWVTSGSYEVDQSDWTLCARLDTIAAHPLVTWSNKQYLYFYDAEPGEFVLDIKFAVYVFEPIPATRVRTPSGYHRHQGPALTWTMNEAGGVESIRASSLIQAPPHNDLVYLRRDPTVSYAVDVLYGDKEKDFFEFGNDKAFGMELTWHADINHTLILSDTRLSRRSRRIRSLSEEESVFYDYPPSPPPASASPPPPSSDCCEMFDVHVPSRPEHSGMYVRQPDLVRGKDYWAMSNITSFEVPTAFPQCASCKLVESSIPSTTLPDYPGIDHTKTCQDLGWTSLAGNGGIKQYKIATILGDETADFVSEKFCSYRTGATETYADAVSTCDALDAQLCTHELLNNYGISVGLGYSHDYIVKLHPNVFRRRHLGGKVIRKILLGF